MNDQPRSVAAGVLVSAGVFIAGCASNEIGQCRDVRAAGIHWGYLLDHDEKLGRTVLTAQFRFAGAKRTTLVLNPPSRFLLDGKEVTAGSSSLSGANYRTELPAEQGNGLHRLLYIDHNGKEYSNTAEVAPFRFVHVPLQVSRNSPVCIRLEFPAQGAGDQVALQHGYRFFVHSNPLCPGYRKLHLYSCT